MFSHIVHWKSWVFSAFLGMMICQTGLAQSSDYPTKPIKIIVPFPAGGPTDQFARQYAQSLSSQIGKPVIVDNKPGAGTVIGVDATAKATDNLTVGGVANSFTVNQSLIKTLPYNTTKDLQPVVLMARTANVLAVKSSLPVNNLKELIDYAKKNPAKLSYGSAGPGTLTHLGMEQIKLASGIFMVHIPYRGVGPAYTDLLAGQTQAMFPTLFAALPYINTNRVRGLAVTGAKRSSAAPNIPTFKELGLNGFDGQQWYGLVGPANLPPAIVTKLNAELNKVLALPDFSEKMTSEAMTLMPMTPPQFANYIKEDIARWAKVAKDRNIEID